MEALMNITGNMGNSQFDIYQGINQIEILQNIINYDIFSSLKGYYNGKT
jgi:hypothetical protein